MNSDRIRRAFLPPAVIYTRLRPEGFLLNGIGAPVAQIQGRIERVSLLRKRFVDSMLVCASPDGIQSRSGLLCDECLHPQCRPQLRLNVRSGGSIYVIHLSNTSAENFFRLEDEARDRGEELVDWIVRVKVEDRGRWGEVTFDRISPR